MFYHPSVYVRLLQGHLFSILEQLSRRRQLTTNRQQYTVYCAQSVKNSLGRDQYIAIASSTSVLFKFLPPCLCDQLCRHLNNMSLRANKHWIVYCMLYIVFCHWGEESCSWPTFTVHQSRLLSSLSSFRHIPPSHSYRLSLRWMSAVV